jgi:hypothetical protein
MTHLHDQQTEEETEAMLAKWLRHRAAAIVALREIANAPRLTSLHEYSGELCDAKWTADVAVAALENQTAKP